MSDEKELAFRYDLFIAPDWRERFNLLVNENITLPPEGRVLDVNSGTGAYTIEIAEKMKGKGEVIGVDPSLERVALASAKALVQKVEGVVFEQGNAASLRFEEEEFDVVIGDASMTAADEIEAMLDEMVRVVQLGGQVILKLTTHGSFDEFFSIYWEALMNTNLLDETWSSLEKFINERVTASDAEEMVKRAGLSGVAAFTNKEEFSYDTAKDFLESPLIGDVFLDRWLSIVPQSRRREVLDQMGSIIDRERHESPFDISVKATVISGFK
jgi:ubiquinone/menaquinone biosynthesis C-methylase UbiE